MDNNIPVTGLDDLTAHMDALIADPSTPLNAKLFDDLELQLTGTLPLLCYLQLYSPVMLLLSLPVLRTGSCSTFFLHLRYPSLLFHLQRSTPSPLASPRLSQSKLTIPLNRLQHPTPPYHPPPPPRPNPAHHALRSNDARLSNHQTPAPTYFQPNHLPRASRVLNPGSRVPVSGRQHPRHDDITQSCLCF